MSDLLPPAIESGSGFELTSIRQFTVFMENKVGRLQQLVRAHEQKGGRIVSLVVQNSADTALVRIICADPDLGRQSLAAEKFSFTEQDVLAVELPRQARQPLMSVCSTLLTAEINIHYMYPLLVRPAGPVVVLYVDDPVLASQLLIKKGLRLIGESDLK
jgi:hypothetical protein